MEKLNNVFVKTIGVIAIIILLFFTINSLFFTYTITYEEKLDFHIGNYWALIVLLGVFLFVKYLTKQKNIINISKKNKLIIFICLFVLYVCFCTILVFKLNIMPKADQCMVINAARDFSRGNFEWMSTYLKVYPNQFGIVMLFYIIEKLPFINLGNDIFVMQIINILFLIFSYITIIKISELMQDKKENIGKILITLLVFFPLTLYITFVYGNIIGFSISTMALYFELLFFKNDKKRYIILSAILSSIAIIAKSNFLIVLIAEIILMFFYALKNKKFQKMMWILVFLAIYIISNKILNYTVFKITGEYPSKGMPKVCWIDMGLHENPNNEAGWYDDKNYSNFIKSGYDYELASEQSKINIKNRLVEFVKNPKEIISFLYRKVSTQWNEPTFESLWIVNSAQIVNGTENVPKVIVDFFSQKTILSKLFVKYCNAIHFWILFGALCYFIIEFKNLDISKISLVLVILGGVAFHILWEAKVQYTLTYFVLFIPYTIIGYEKLIDIIIEKRNYKHEIKLLK